MEVFRQAAETYTRELLARIALDYSLPLDDLLKYADLTVPTPTVQSSKTPNAFDKPLCQAVTSTGTRCRFYARQDGLCGKHCAPSESAGTPRTCQPVANTVCSGTTAKGAPCKFAAKTAVGLCGTHLRKTVPTPPTGQPTASPVRSRSPTPPPARAPKTTSVPRKAPSPNPTVQPKATTTNPSVLEEDPEDDEAADSPGLQERLRAILREASESDDDPDDEDPPSLNLDALRAALDTVDVSELLSEDDASDDD
jgi:hypothetical protein